MNPVVLDPETNTPEEEDKLGCRHSIIGLVV